MTPGKEAERSLEVVKGTAAGVSLSFLSVLRRGGRPGQEWMINELERKRRIREILTLTEWFADDPAG